MPPHTFRWLHWNLLFHWDLAVLVGLKRNADISEIENTKEYCYVVIIQNIMKGSGVGSHSACSLTFCPGRLVCTNCFSQRCRQLQGCHLPSSDVHLITKTNSNITLSVNMNYA